MKPAWGRFLLEQTCWACLFKYVQLKIGGSQERGLKMTVCE